MTDESGHQLPNIVYPGLDRGELVEWVERFYGEYYFRPKAAWRVVRKAIVNNDIPRLYKEAREYLALRSKRKKFVKEHKAATVARESMSAKARLLTLVVILSNVAGNLAVQLRVEIGGGRSLAACISRCWSTDSVDALADDADELGGSELHPSYHRDRIRAVGYRRQDLSRGADFDAALERNTADRCRNHAGRPHTGGDALMRWLLVVAIVASTAVGDLLQSFEMKQHKQASIGQTLGFLHRPLLLLSILCMAVVVLLLPGAPAGCGSELRRAGNRGDGGCRNRTRPAGAERARRWTALGRSGAGRVRRGAAGCVILLVLICAAAGAYQLARPGGVHHASAYDATEYPPTRPAVSILKPIHGADDHFWPAIVSHARDRVSRVRDSLWCAGQQRHCPALYSRGSSRNTPSYPSV